MWKIQLSFQRFANKINKLCKRKKICLIIDEITTGWKETNGGLYKCRLNLILLFMKSLKWVCYLIYCWKKKYMKFTNKLFSVWLGQKELVLPLESQLCYFKNKMYQNI